MALNGYLGSLMSVMKGTSMYRKPNFSITQSESNDNRTRRHPVDLLAGHLFI